MIRAPKIPAPTKKVGTHDIAHAFDEVADLLDLDDAHCRMAKSEGVRLSLGSDAHRTSDFADLEFAVAQARRGWLEAEDIVNTLPVARLKELIAASR